MRNVGLFCLSSEDSEPLWDEREFAGGPLTCLRFHKAEALRSGLVAASSDPHEAPIRVVLAEVSLLMNEEELRDLVPLAQAWILVVRPVEVPFALGAIAWGVADFWKLPLAPGEAAFRLKTVLDRLGPAPNLEPEHRNHQAERLNERLKSIIEATREVAGPADMENLGPLLMKRFAANMAAEGGSLFLVRKQSLKRVCSLDPGHAPDLIALPPKADSPLWKVLNDKTPVLIADVEESPMARSGWTGYQGRSGLIFPLTDETREVLGIITLHNKIGSPFTEQDKYLGMILASLSSEALLTLETLEALKRSEERYKQFFQENITADAVLDATGQITLYNPAFSRIFEVPQGREGYQIREFFLPDTEWPSIREEIVACRTALFHDRLMKTASGRIITVTGSFTGAFHSEGRLESVQVFLSDVTKRKRVENLFSNTRKMEALGRLAASIARDFGGILSRVVACGHKLRQAVRAPELAPQIEDLIQSAEHGTELTRQLVALGSQDRAPALIVEPDTLIRGMKDLFLPLTAGRVSVEWELRSDGARILIHPGDFERMLLQFVLKARDSMRQGGVVRIKTAALAPHSPEVLLRPEIKPGHYFQIKICDTGEGIPKEFLDRIFEPFFGIKSPELGSGLGLSLAYNSILAAGGTVEVESTPGIGTDFLVFFPLIDGPATDSADLEGPGRANGF